MIMMITETITSYDNGTYFPYTLYIWVKIIVVVVVVLGFTTLLTSQVISVAFYSEREKFDKFCSEALISA